jgi:hypothetical protein
MHYEFYDLTINTDKTNKLAWGAYIKNVYVAKNVINECYFTNGFFWCVPAKKVGGPD